jgi:L-aminopeptidase/D-esterase-like protein
MKGVGCASARLGQVVIAALVVVNAAGDIIDWRRGTIVAGARTNDGRGFARTADVLRRDLESRGVASAPLAEGPLRATTLGVIATNVAFTKTELTKLAMMATREPRARFTRITRKATVIRCWQYRRDHFRPTYR